MKSQRRDIKTQKGNGGQSELTQEECVGHEKGKVDVKGAARGD